MKNSNFSKKLTIALTLFVVQVFSQSSFTDQRDGKKYKAVKIGEQVWMAENLNYNAEGSRCYGEKGLMYLYVGGKGISLSPSEIQDNCAKYGRLYDWATAMNIDTAYNNSGDNSLNVILGNVKDKDSVSKNILWGGSDVKHQGICPVGWHLPNSDEWIVLAKFVGDSIAQVGGGSVVANVGDLTLTIANKSSNVGIKLKAKNGWNQKGNGTDDFGFAALPCGYSSSADYFYDFGEVGYWWSATENKATNARSRRFKYNYDNIDVSINKKIHKLSVRCIKD
ncbi:MAG: fibrobacter succinogenes major paralogous domain-containing protein [Fibromonadaceae bacterium]|jgi:uncharacterized protein (TIGR02145 family)|nr:fibrobacter succinogenes major paralogous domain-containing protein [Fibromonadaceae bacterium]